MDEARQEGRRFSEEEEGGEGGCGRCGGENEGDGVGIKKGGEADGKQK